MVVCFGNECKCNEIAESAEKYTRLLINTCLFPKDNTTRQLRASYLHIPEVWSNIMSVYKILQVLR